MPKSNVKNVVLPHSEAKLQMYQGYLLKYIQILVASQQFKQINLYDVFCGSGIYEDGKAGSPVLAFETIRRNREWSSSNKILNPTPIKLCINDIEQDKVESVKHHLLNQVQPINCTLDFNNLPAADFISKVNSEVNGSLKGVRNLVFIDPYGYKDIQAHILTNLLINGSTEIILFLPVSFIYRFAGAAQTQVEATQYEHLRTFISSFFPENHPIRRNEMTSPLDFINSLKAVMSFNKFYSASYFIQRDKGNYFALFFMTSNLLGLEKFLKTKWELDPNKGQGFKRQDPIPSLFDEFFKKEDRDERLHDFSQRLKVFIKGQSRTDKSIYEFTLLNEFLPEHTSSILKQWQQSGIIEVWQSESRNLARKGSFNINYDSTKPEGSKFTFNLK